MKKLLTVKNIVGAIVVIWIIFSLGYVARDQWIRYQSKQLQMAYQQGVQTSVNTLISESEKCQPIPIFSDEKEVQLISVDCLQKMAEDASSSSPEQPAQ